MAFYLVRGRLKPELASDLRLRLDRGEFRDMQPFGAALTRALEEARRDPETGEAVWEEEDYCSPPLRQEREAALDRYFEALKTERVSEGDGWTRISHLPPLWEKVA